MQYMLSIELETTDMAVSFFKLTLMMGSTTVCSATA